MTASSAHSMKRLSPSHCNMPLAARRIFKYLALIHLLSILSVNGNDTTPPNCDSQTSRYDPLACWLWKGSIRIPNQSFIDGIIKIQIRDMICTHFQITSISSQYIASLPPVIDPSLQLSVGDTVLFNCIDYVLRCCLPPFITHGLCLNHMFW